MVSGLKTFSLKRYKIAARKRKKMLANFAFLRFFLGICATIRIGWEILCLPYEGFFKYKIQCNLWWNFSKWNSLWRKLDLERLGGLQFKYPPCRTAPATPGLLKWGRLPGQKWAHICSKTQMSARLCSQSCMPECLCSQSWMCAYTVSPECAYGFNEVPASDSTSEWSQNPN